MLGFEKLSENTYVQKKEEPKKKGNRPDYVGDGVAVWLKEDKNKKIYLSISLFGGQINIRAFKNDSKNE